MTTPRFGYVICNYKKKKKRTTWLGSWKHCGLVALVRIITPLKPGEPLSSWCNNKHTVQVVEKFVVTKSVLPVRGKRTTASCIKVCYPPRHHPCEFVALLNHHSSLLKPQEGFENENRAYVILGHLLKRLTCPCQDALSWQWLLNLHQLWVLIFYYICLHCDHISVFNYMLSWETFPTNTACPHTERSDASTWTEIIFCSSVAGQSEILVRSRNPSAFVW